MGKCVVTGGEHTWDVWFGSDELQKYRRSCHIFGCDVFQIVEAGMLEPVGLKEEGRYNWMTREYDPTPVVCDHDWKLWYWTATEHYTRTCKKCGWWQEAKSLKLIDVQ